MKHSTPERPVNLYRQRGDREVWERAQKDAEAADCSLSRHVVAVLRKDQERAGIREAELGVIAAADELVRAGDAEDHAMLRDLIAAVDALGRATGFAKIAS